MIRKKNRGTVLRMCDDRAGWTGRDAIIAPCTPFKKQLFSHRTRRTQPINTRRCRRRLRRETIGLFDELMRGSDRRDHRIFQEIPPAI